MTMSDVPPTNASVEAQVEDQPPNHHRAKTASEIQYEEARVIFNKTIGGHYRHGENRIQRGCRFVPHMEGR